MEEFIFHKGIRLSDYLEEVTTRSARKCRTKCFHEKSCVAFSINKRDKKCFLFDDKFRTNSIETAKKWDTYSKIKIVNCDCPCQVN